ncbi:MAG: hypothetical protein J6A21_03215 [Lentisphaeria bacterium]|nr:hypothetical protein [Lentisphaeria bacterium]
MEMFSRGASGMVSFRSFSEPNLSPAKFFSRLFPLPGSVFARKNGKKEKTEKNPHVISCGKDVIVSQKDFPALEILFREVIFYGDRERYFSRKEDFP